MKTDPSRFAVGDEWVYRVREYEPSERVRILAVTLNKNTARLDVIFPDDPTQRVENIPGSRLRAPWSEAARHNTLMANWHRIIQPKLSDVESYSASEVFSVLIPDDVATTASSQVPDATAIHDQTRLEAITGVSTMELLADVEWFEHENAVMVSPAGTLRIAEAACLANPTPVLESIAADPTQGTFTERSVRQPRSTPTTGANETTSHDTSCYASGAAVRQRRPMTDSWPLKPRTSAWTASSTNSYRHSNAQVRDH
jgi:hypothetical protein